MTNCTKHGIIKLEKSPREVGEIMVWREMSYEVYTQTGQETEPEIWDEIYEPTLEEWIGWISE